MRLSTRRQLDLGYAVSLTVLLLVGVASFLSITALRRNQDAVVDVQEALRLLSAVEADLAEAESSQRGFVLTGNAEFLAPYLSIRGAVDDELAALSGIPSSGPHQQTLLDSLGVLVERKLETMDGTVQLARNGEADRARAMVARGLGREIMASIHNVIEEMTTAELRILRERSDLALASARRAIFVIVLGTFIAFFLVGLARRRIFLDLKAREAAEQALSAREGVIRRLYEIVAAEEQELIGKLGSLLEMGRLHLGVDIGVIARVTGNRYEVLAARDPMGEVRAGDVFPLEETYCSVPLRSKDVVSVAHAAESDWANLPCYSRFGLEAYIGVPIAGGDDAQRVLCFSSREPRPAEFTEGDHDLLRLMSQWIGAAVQRRHAEEALQEREEKYRSLVEAASDLIYTVDAEGRITYANPVVLRTVGYTESELIGRPLRTLIRSDWRDSTDAFYEDQIRSGAPNTYYEFPAETKDGREVWLGQIVTLLEDTGAVTGMQAVARDITRQREVELLKEEFLSVVSHELRTPLTAIRGSLGLLVSGKMGKLDERGQRMLEIAAQNTDRLVRLINDLLDMEKIESGKAPMERSMVPASEVFGPAVAELGGTAEKAGVRLVVEPIEAELYVDPDRLHQVFTNLISNAIKFSDPGDIVELSAERTDTELVFAIRDTGRGIPADKLESIFEKFQQVDSSDSRQKGGTGLGLPIARSIVEQHGGRLWVESVWGVGSAFRFSIPHSREAAVSAAREEHALILICEPDTQMCAEIQRMLESYGYRAAAAATAADAHRLARELKPAAILLDALAPGVAGGELLDELSRASETSAIPLVVLTSTEVVDAPVHAARVMEWLSRPLTPDGIGEAVARAVSERERCDVLLVEDDDGVAAVLSELLHARGISARRARDGAEAIELSRTTEYRLLMLDLGLPGTDGFAVVSWLRHHNRLRSLPLVVFTARDLDTDDRIRLRLGPTEFMTKGRETVEQVAQRAVDLLRSRNDSPTEVDG